MNLSTAQSRTESSNPVEVNLRVNGSPVSVSLPARVTLSDALRDHLGLTGTHVGCEHGICGMFLHAGVPDELVRPALP